MKVGAIISRGEDLFVITQITNGTISQKVPIKEFVSRNSVIEYKGEFKTLNEIIEIHCDDYILRNELIKFP